MKLSRSGLKLIKEWSALRMNAYQGKDGVWMIGYGSIRWESGALVKEGDRLVSVEQADALLEYSLRNPIRVVNSHIKCRLTQNQFDALVSLVYDIKGGLFYTSGLIDLIEAGQTSEAAAFLAALDIAGCEPAGTRTTAQRINRRKREAQIFNLL